MFDCRPGVVICALLGAVMHPAAQGKPVAIAVATVVDTQGIHTDVTGLAVVYKAGGTWIGSRPRREADYLRLMLFSREGRITVPETMDLRFSDMLELTLSGSHTECVPARRAQLRIQRRDGSVVVLKASNCFDKRSVPGPPDTLEESDQAGQVKRTGDLLYFGFWHGEEQGQQILIDSLRGQAKTSSGKHGVFEIPFNEVEQIRFR